MLIAGLIALFGFREDLLRLLSWFGSLEAIATSMEHAGIWAPVVLFILFVLQVFLAFIPGQALMIACGYLYGFWAGFLLSWLSLVVGGEIAYLLARRFAQMLAVAVAVAVFSTIAGIYISFLIDSAPAPTIVVIMTGLFIAAFVRTLAVQARTGVRPA